MDAQEFYFLLRFPSNGEFFVFSCPKFCILWRKFWDKKKNISDKLKIEGVQLPTSFLSQRHCLTTREDLCKAYIGPIEVGAVNIIEQWSIICSLVEFCLLCDCSNRPHYGFCTSVCSSVCLVQAAIAGDQKRCRKPKFVWTFTRSCVLILRPLWLNCIQGYGYAALDRRPHNLSTLGRRIFCHFCTMFCEFSSDVDNSLLNEVIISLVFFRVLHWLAAFTMMWMDF